MTEEPLPEPQSQTPPPEARPRLRDHVVGMRGVAAVALAGLILGGAGGALLGAASAGGDDDRMGPGRGGFGGPGQMPQFPGQPPQQGIPGQGQPGGP
jgi:hypothetical protein